MTTIPAKETPARAMRHNFTGIVLSDKADKTRVVLVEWLDRHPRYDKTVRKRSKFYAHDEKNESHTGDKVEIMGTRPISKLKRWRVVRIVEKARIPGESGVASAASKASEPEKEAA